MNTRCRTDFTTAQLMINLRPRKPRRLRSTLRTVSPPGRTVAVLIPRMPNDRRAFRPGGAGGASHTSDHTAMDHPADDGARVDGKPRLPPLCGLGKRERGDAGL